MIEEKLSGPVHSNVAFAAFVVAVRYKVSPTHGELAVAVTVTVLPMVCTLSVAEEEHPFWSITVTVYSPAVNGAKTLLATVSPPFRIYEYPPPVGAVTVILPLLEAQLVLLETVREGVGGRGWTVR